MRQTPVPLHRRHSAYVLASTLICPTPKQTPHLPDPRQSAHWVLTELSIKITSSQASADRAGETTRSRKRSRNPKDALGISGLWAVQDQLNDAQGAPEHRFRVNRAGMPRGLVAHADRAPG